MDQTNRYVVRDSLGVFLFGYQNNKCLIKELQSLLVHLVKMVNCLDHVQPDNAPVAGEEQSNIPIWHRCFLFWGRVDYNLYLLLHGWKV
jgi:hypothetical protein